MNLIDKITALRTIIKDKGSLIIAFSGGVDSSLIAKIAFEELGENALAVTIDSDTFSKRELDISKQVASEIGIMHKIIKISEMNNPIFIQNPVDRCYYCKKEEIMALKKIARESGFLHVAFGVNVSDFNEHRPGIKALKEERYFQPLVEAGIDKIIIPSIARMVGLSNHDLPSTTCLASRIPYGEEITKEKLMRIEDAESFLFSLGVRQSRVRNHQDLARIEVFPEDFTKIIKNRNEIIESLKRVGYAFVALDLEGYRSGSMNEVL